MPAANGVELLYALSLCIFQLLSLCMYNRERVDIDFFVSSLIESVMPKYAHVGFSDLMPP